MLAKQDYPRSTEELVRMMEAMHEVGEPTNFWRSVTDEPYIVFVNGLVKAEGEIANCTDSEEKAIRLAWEGFKIYSESVGSDAILYWRIKPEYTTHKSRHRVYMRLLLSHTKPATHDALDKAILDIEKFKEDREQVLTR